MPDTGTSRYWEGTAEHMTDKNPCSCGTDSLSEMAPWMWPMGISLKPESSAEYTLILFSLKLPGHLIIPFWYLVVHQYQLLSNLTSCGAVDTSCRKPSFPNFLCVSLQNLGNAQSRSNPGSFKTSLLLFCVMYTPLLPYYIMNFLRVFS